MLARTLAATALLALTTACAAGGGGGEAPRRVPDGFKPSSCSIDEVGGTAVHANAGKTEVVDSGFFAKQLNLPDLDAVSHSSALSTAIYGSAINAKVMSVPSSVTVPDGKCLSYAFLPDAGERELSIWNEASGGGANGGQLQGLYYDDGKPTILVLRGTDRWTLVHELTHYNFDKTRKSMKKPNVRQLDARIRSKQKEFEGFMTDYTQLPNRGDLEKAANSLGELIVLTYGRMVDSSLEEVAIEALLIDRFASGKLSNVSKESAQSGHWYIQVSKDTALSAFNDYVPLLNKVEQLANESIWTDIADKMDVQRRFLGSLKQRLNEMEEKARREAGVPDPVPNSIGSESNEPSAVAAAYVAMVNPHVLHSMNTPEYRQIKRNARQLALKFR